MRYFANFPGQLSGRQRLFAFFSLLISTVILLSFWTSPDVVTRGLVTLIISGLIVVSQPLWRPADYGKNLIRRYSLYVVMVTALAGLGYSSSLQQIAISAVDQIGRYFGFEPAFVPPVGLTFGAVFGFVWLSVFTVNYLVRDTSVMREHPVSLDQEFPEEGYKERLTRFCGELANELTRIDEETNWNHWWFIPLDAEVEVRSGPEVTRRLDGLLDALRKQHANRLFVVLGDPGSGKSIALRKLARELLSEVEDTGRVPIYVNLKEWDIAATWAPNNPPRYEQLRRFVLDATTRRLSRFSRRFLDEYFDKMLEQGRLFLILDSFDEAPGIIDSEESSWLVKELSQMVTAFLVGGNISRGIIASRFYRRPRVSATSVCTLEIRPFSDLQIRDFARQQLPDGDAFARRLFADRPDLVSLMRNPFSAGLVIEYAAKSGGALPSTQLELFESYIGLSLDDVKREDTEALRSFSSAVACLMFDNPRYGLEIPIAEIRTLMQVSEADTCIDALVAARIARKGGSERPSFTFVHRRFAEYFLVRQIALSGRAMDMEAIVSDSKWRDALVLYFEVTPAAEQSRVVDQCLGFVQSLPFSAKARHEAPFLRSVHALRFLQDAMRSKRLEESQTAGLVDVLGRVFESSSDLLVRKLAVESVGLLPDDKARDALVRAFGTNNPWISEAAFRACRHFGGTSKELQDSLRRYIFYMWPVEFWRRREEIQFSLGLSSTMAAVASFARARSIDLTVLLWASVVVSILHPAAVAVMSLVPITFFVGAVAFGSFAVGRTSLNGMFEMLGRNLTAFYGGSIALVTMLALLVGVSHIPRPLNASLLMDGQWTESVLRIGLSYLHVLDPLSAPITMLAPPGSQSVVANMVLLAAGYYVVCVLPTWYLLPSIVRWVLHIVISRPLRLVLFGLAYLFVALVTVVAIEWLRPLYQTAFFSLLFFASFVGALLLVAQLSRHIAEAWRDRRRLKDVCVGVSRTRERVAEDFSQLRTIGGRLRYLGWLEEQHIRPEGAWSDGVPPYLGEDAASTRLAMLDERWLGLDR